MITAITQISTITKNDITIQLTINSDKIILKYNDNGEITNYNNSRNTPMVTRLQRNTSSKIISTLQGF